MPEFFALTDLQRTVLLCFKSLSDKLVIFASMCLSKQMPQPSIPPLIHSQLAEITAQTLLSIHTSFSSSEEIQRRPVTSWGTLFLQRNLGLLWGLFPVGCVWKSSPERRSGGMWNRDLNHFNWLHSTWRSSSSTLSLTLFFLQFYLFIYLLDFIFCPIQNNEHGSKKQINH